ncbi:cytochrome P450 2C18-like [Saccostrea echinata]|uniref:cytochrome P450 2C18-like n=1 Tax=Saccostrea echinata TaxID=191078 RepID=UPI002A8279BE|nr:cytochrome P450 2C18-like [Saccostrea echinata]
MWVTLTIVAVLICLIWSLTGRPKGLPPGPTCYPIIGNVGIFKPSEAVKAHRRLRKIHGDIYTIMIFHKPIIFVHGFENIRQLLAKHGDVFSERPRSLATDLTAGNGVVWSSGPLWKETRAFALMTLRKFGFGKRCLESQIMEEVDCFMEKLENYESEAFDIQSVLNASVANVICSLLFGKRFDYEDARFKRLIYLLSRSLSSVTTSSPVFIFPSLRHIRIFNIDSIEEDFNVMREFINETIEEHRRHFDEDHINDFIDAFLLEQKQRSNEINTTFTDENLNQTLRDFFVAGTESTSTTLKWAFLYLIHYPHWQKKLQKEIDDVIGQGQPKMEHKDLLPLVDAFIQETLRLANISPLNIPHAGKEDITYKGYLFPKGATVLFNLDSVLMDPEIFPEPSKFKTERFLGDSRRCHGGLKDKLVSFSLGPRVCLGEALAKMELFLFLTRFLQKFEIKPEDPKYMPSLEGNLGITNTPQAFKMILLRR